MAFIISPARTSTSSRRSTNVSSRPSLTFIRHAQNTFSRRSSLSPIKTYPSHNTFKMTDAPPINAPSTLLLLTSCVFAIATVGCTFELSGGHPQYGQNLTAGIFVVSLPTFIFMFYAAIKKGQQEALDDP